LTKYSWSAVVRGAVAVGLEGINSAVVYRKSRRHYGTVCCTPFKHSVHDEADWFIHPQTRLPTADNQMMWLMTKGQDLHASEPTHATKKLVSRFWPEDSRVALFTLMACDMNQSPSHAKHGVSQQMIIMFITNDNQAIYHVVTLTINLGEVPQEHYVTEYSTGGRPYYNIHVEVNISLQSALEFFVTIKGKKYGSVTVEYD
jgi:hypothetical protein